MPWSNSHVRGWSYHGCPIFKELTQHDPDARHHIFLQLLLYMFVYICILIYVLMNSLDRFGLGPQVGSFSVDFFRATLAPPILQMHRELLKPKGPRESAVSGRIFKVCPNTSVVSPPSSTTSPNTWRPWISVHQTTWLSSRPADSRWNLLRKRWLLGFC